MHLPGRALFVAIAGASALGAPGAAQAVSVAANGWGEVLVYPYYTVRGSAAGVPYNTLLSIVNTTDSTKAVKIRFREGKASAEVLDFNIFLSPYDVWTGYLEPSAASGGTKICTTDKSARFRRFPRLVSSSAMPITRATLPRTTRSTRLREGYFEVFEMATYASSTTTARSAKHGANGIPAACTAITDELAGTEDQQRTRGVCSERFRWSSPPSPARISRSTPRRCALNVEWDTSDTGSMAPGFSDGEEYSVTATDNGECRAGNLGQRFRRCGIRGADEDGDHQRIRPRYRDQLGDELGGDLPNQAFLRRQQRDGRRRAVPERADPTGVLRRSRDHHLEP